MEAFWWWLVVAAVAALVEAVSFSLITVWFVAGALVAFGVAFAGGPLWLQLVVFLAVSLACLAGLRPVALKYRSRGESFEPTLVGQQAQVVEEVDPVRQTGRVQTADRMTWAALSGAGEPLEVGVVVRVTGQQSVKLVVERM